jgi:hypothetical protein
VTIDDLCQQLTKPLPMSGLKRWRKSLMCASEVITCVIFWMLMWFKTVADIHRNLLSYHQDCFDIPWYKNFVQAVNRYSVDATRVLLIIMKCNKQQAIWDVKCIDATCVAVCNNKRIFDHQVCSWSAQRGKSTMWWFYWYKLHIVTDSRGNLLSFTITPWNVDDRAVVEKILQWIEWVVLADAWYISADLLRKLHEIWITFLSWYKVNMKKMVTKDYIKKLKLRQIIETWFGMMKQWWNLVSPYARSIWGHFCRMIYNLLTYCIRKMAIESYISIS